ncbi:MAG: rhomboid family intramembrane serine protease [Ruminococcaceae bacterium]|nr:rhomboid family intramembrane serine protease [Oscillospiraceae bacterium]
MKFRGITYNSPVILSFAVLSLAALLLSFVTGGISNRMFFSVYHSSLLDPFTYPRFFLHILGHSSWAHYINNMLMLLVIGPPMEEKYGSRSLTTAIIITAFITGVVQWIFFPGSGVLGASGIVFMLIVLSSLSGMKNGEIPLTLLLVLILYLGGELVSGVTVKDNISQLTHIIGGLCGAFLGFYLRK